MKTFKSVLILLLVAVTMAGYASADGFKIKPAPKKIVSISFERAIKNPGLILAMYQQLNAEFLNSNQKVYTVCVLYDDSIYKITGTYDQWKLFFNLNIKLPVHYDKIMIG